MTQPFRDLRITGIQSDLCYVTTDSVFRIYLRLSDTPPLGWSFIFTKYWGETLYENKAEVGMVDATIWIECPPADFRSKHLPWLEYVLAQVNECFRQTRDEQSDANRADFDSSTDAYAQLAELERSFLPVAEQSRAHKRFDFGIMGRTIKRLLGGARTKTEV